MAAQLKEIVDRLNAEPFNLDLSLLVFDEKDLLIDQIFHRYHPWMNGYLCDCFFFQLWMVRKKQLWDMLMVVLMEVILMVDIDY